MHESSSTIVNSTKSFTFHGNGSEYFKLWIVNIMLTILTLGIYSAWAKVRNTQYFYGNLELDGHRFQYLANPIAILIGRVIAIALFIFWNVMLEYNIAIGLTLSIIVFFATPWLIKRSFVFHHAMTAYRNIRFNFHASYADSFMVFIVWPLLTLVSFGILAPKAIAAYYHYKVANSSYGASRFEFSATYKNYIKLWVMMVLGFIAIVLFMFMVLKDFFPFMLGFFIACIAYLAIYAFYFVKTMNIFYNYTKIKDIHFNATIPFRQYTQLFLVNSLLIILTLGFYIPFAQVKFAQFFTNYIVLKAEQPLDQFIAAEQEQVTAFGQEFSEVIGVDVAPL